MTVGDMISGKQANGRYVTGVVTEIDGSTLVIDGIDVIDTRRDTYRVEQQDVLTSIARPA